MAVPQGAQTSRKVFFFNHGRFFFGGLFFKNVPAVRMQASRMTLCEANPASILAPAGRVKKTHTKRRRGGVILVHRSIYDGHKVRTAIRKKKKKKRGVMVPGGRCPMGCATLVERSSQNG